MGMGLKRPCDDLRFLFVLVCALLDLGGIKVHFAYD